MNPEESGPPAGGPGGSPPAGPERELRATYRLQLTADFGFDAARQLIPYLRDLGISHLYLSPSLQAREGSTHGYDVVDPGRLSSALGGEEAFRRLACEAHNAGLGIILDVVPNHMAADDANRFWADGELRQKFFDIDPVSGGHRRFFDIGELAGVRQEDPEVFHATHDFTLSLVRDGLVDGLRVDHPDGLADPAGYLQQLRCGGAERVWVEKILDPGEQLRDGWAVSGTVGYEFLNDVCALFVDRSGEEALSALWREISGDERLFAEVAQEAKLQQATGTFAPEVERLGREDPSVEASLLPSALAALPVYRTYVEPAGGRVEAADREAVAGLPEEIFARLLLERDCPPEFVVRFQQTTPAIMAKGVEDTAFYRYARLLALNDVGGDPSRFGISVEEFHAANLERARRFPENLLTRMTHDAKRSADVRARIGSLAGMPVEWAAAVREWMAATEALVLDGAPDDLERYVIFQTLVGAWPIEVERVEEYMEKALREAKRNTAWVDGDEQWEARVKAFVRALYSHRPFLDSFAPFAKKVAAIGDRSALRQLVLELTCPGVPDIYQGDEVPYRALVDPDNRRPVDFDWRQAMLRRLMGGSPPDAETLKLFLTMRLLGLRARRLELFAGASYEPLDAGPLICAFTRGEGQLVVAVALPDRVPEVELAVPEGRWQDVLRGEERQLDGAVAAPELLGEPGMTVLLRR